MIHTVLHLSDIHFRLGHNSLHPERAKLIISALEECLPTKGELITTITGDIAYSGQPAEYSLAVDFLSHLEGELKSRRPGMRHTIALAPGNHDCDFKKDNSARQMLLDQLRNNESTGQVLDGSIITPVTAVQDDFFAFAEAVGQETPTNKVAWERRLHGMNVRIVVCNTAWMSRLKEEEASLRIPVECLPPALPDMLTIALMHHPLNWMSSTNARELRTKLHETADVVLTGHEHASEQYVRELRDGGVFFSEGTALFSEEGSGFTTYAIDTETGTVNTRHFKFDTAHQSYIQGEQATHSFRSIRNRSPSGFRISNEMSHTLADLGVRFTHPKVKSLSINDVFLYPDLEERSSESRDSTDPRSSVNFESHQEYWKKHTKLLVVGEPISGKTTLLRRVFSDLHRTGITPVILNGRDLRSITESSLAEELKQTFIQQYSKDQYDRWIQLPSDRKAVLVDDLHLLKGSARDREELTSWLETRVRHVLLFADESIIAGQLSNVDSAKSLLSYRHLVIREFGRRLRGRLIEAWCGLGMPSGEEEEEFDSRVADRERLIDLLLGKNILPSYPLFILTLLQTIEAEASHHLTSGSLGYVYEHLIKAALLESGQDMPMDAKLAFAAAVAHQMMRNDVDRITRTELETVAERYRSKTRLNLNTIKMTSHLVRGGVLEEIGDGLQFKYPYVFYYFAARKLADGLRQSAEQKEMQTEIEKIVENMHHEDSANILVFLVYLAKDEFIMDLILAMANQQYAQHPRARLEDDAKRLGPAMPLEISLGNEPPKSARERDRRSHDEVHAQMRTFDDEEAEKLDEVIRLNVALKTLQIIGQVLRNSPGSLGGERKRQLVEACYDLGLRLMTASLEAINGGDRDQLVDFLTDVFKKKRSDLSHQEASQKANAFLYFMTFGIAYGIIKRISMAVGSKYFDETYKDVIKEDAPVSVRLIDLAVRFDHIRPLPETEAVRLYKKIHQDNFFSSLLIKQIASEHLRLHAVNFRVRQRLAQELGLEKKSKKILPMGVKK